MSDIKRAPGGRPKKTPGERRTMPAKLYFTAGELEFLQLQQFIAGYKQFSRFMYDYIFGMMADGRFVCSVPRPVNHQLQKDLAGIARNINLLVQEFHSTGDVEYAKQATARLMRALKALKLIADDVRKQTDHLIIKPPASATTEGR